MKHLYILFISVILIFQNTAAQHISYNDVEQIKQEILRELNEISRRLGPKLHPRDRQFLEQRLNEISSKLEYLTEQSYNVYSVYPMSDAEFHLLSRMIENESFESDKMKVIIASVPGKYFTIYQLTRLLEEFSFEDNRLKVVEIIYPAIVDRENSDLLFDYFTFSSSKEKLNSIILGSNRNRQSY